jgi:hypothetical protein
LNATPQPQDNHSNTPHGIVGHGAGETLRGPV